MRSHPGRLPPPRRCSDPTPTLCRLGTILMTLVAASLPVLAAEDSPIKDDEVVVFFPGLGRPVSRSEEADWELQLRGWIFEPEKDSWARAGLMAALRESLGLDEGEARTALFDERGRKFLVDNERGKEIRVVLGKTAYTLGESAANGHFSGTVRIPADELRALKEAPGNSEHRLRFRAVTRSDDPREFTGEIFLVEGRGLSVISDIDDTVKVTGTTSKRELIQNTFLREYRAIPGMAGTYRKLKKAGAVFHYVSASPWQLYEPLETFLQGSGFPAGTFHLKSFRLKDSSFFNLFASPGEYKLSVLEPLVAMFPDRSFVLIGDSTEKDPETYGELARRHPEAVMLVCIREAPDARLSAERLAKAFREVPAEKWMTFREASELVRRLPAE